MIKLSELKKALDKLTPRELNEYVYISGREAGIGTVADRFVRSRCDLYKLPFEDLQLETLTGLKKNGLSQEEIDEHEIVIPKGVFVLEI